MPLPDVPAASADRYRQMLSRSRADKLPPVPREQQGQSAAGEQVIEDAAESSAVPQCRHRGEQIDTTGCRTCGGVRQLPVFTCGVNGRCTVLRRAVDADIAWCGDCQSMSPVWYTRSTQELHDDLAAWSERLPEISAVCGIPRSGVPAAGLLALIRNIPLLSFRELLEGHDGYRRQDGRTLRTLTGPVLVLDDTSWTGRAMRDARRQLRQPVMSRVRAGATAGLPGSAEPNLIFGAVYAGRRGQRQCDVWAEPIANWHHVFEWNVARDVHSQHAMLDLDGVIAPDPPPPYDFPDVSQTPAESYLQFLASATPQRWPGFRVHTICTARLERFRPQTEAWLARHGIDYQRLLMHPAATWQDRERYGHAEYKADHYAASRCTLFVESRPAQARRIHELTGRPVISTKPWQVYQ